jgi:hypothetical protein
MKTPSGWRPNRLRKKTGFSAWAHGERHRKAANHKPRNRCLADLVAICGRLPWQVRLFNELGGVLDWTGDTDGDRFQDQLRQDMYPESTAFGQIGISRLWPARARRPR